MKLNWFRYDRSSFAVIWSFWITERANIDATMKFCVFFGSTLVRDMHFRYSQKRSRVFVRIRYREIGGGAGIGTFYKTE